MTLLGGVLFLAGTPVFADTNTDPEDTLVGAIIYTVGSALFLISGVPVLKTYYCRGPDDIEWEDSF